jgi:hypothetical protein
MGSKPDDRWTVPLCRECHTEQHAGNEQEYWEKKRYDPLEAALLLKGASPDIELGEQVMRKIWGNELTAQLFTAKTERDALRDRIEVIEPQLSMSQQACDNYRAENAKLRELLLKVLDEFDAALARRRSALLGLVTPS